MKKIICILVALVLLATVAFPAVAAGGFVKSITYKGSPALLGSKGVGMTFVRHDEEAVLEGIDTTADGEPMEEVDFAEGGCLVITSVAEAKTTKKIPEEARELLLKVYQELSDGTMVLPYEKVEGIAAEKMVIRELLDVRLVCDHPHKTELSKEDVAIVLTFDLGVAADDVLAVMTYVNEEWVPAVEVTNNGDGTVTCVLEDLCPVAFAIEA